jgi:predicted secreted protein
MGTIIEGSALRMYIDGVVVAKETESSISFSVEGKEVRHKDLTDNWSSVTAGTKSCEIRGSALYSDDESLEDIFEAFKDGEPVAVIFQDPGDSYAFSGDFLILTLEANATDGENATYSWTAKNVGEIERKAVTT